VVRGQGKYHLHCSWYSGTEFSNLSLSRAAVTQVINGVLAGQNLFAIAAGRMQTFCCPSSQHGTIASRSSILDGVYLFTVDPAPPESCWNFWAIRRPSFQVHWLLKFQSSQTRREEN
jgi:hypothetical protein